MDVSGVGWTNTLENRLPIHPQKLLLCLVSLGDFPTCAGYMAASGELALDWESCRTIRSRFRREISWIQWPAIAEDVTGDPDDRDKDEDDNPAKQRPVCTKALELNADAVLVMMDFYDGNFVDIYKLQSQVPIDVTSLCTDLNQ